MFRSDTNQETTESSTQSTTDSGTETPPSPKPARPARLLGITLREQRDSRTDLLEQRSDIELEIGKNGDAKQDNGAQDAVHKHFVKNNGDGDAGGENGDITISIYESLSTVTEGK